MVRVLDADPDLTETLPPEAAAAAAGLVAAPVQVVAPGPWSPPDRGDPATLGCLVLEGTLIARTQLWNGAAAAELLGPGDVVLPWMPSPGGATVSTGIEWSVLQEARIALLDRPFVVQVSSWPEITATLAARLANRARALDVLLALRSAPGIERRMLVLLWVLAERFGKVTPAGVRLEMPLTHQVLAELAGARRPTVTTALAQLRRQGIIEFLTERRGWTLRGQPPSELPPSLRVRVTRRTRRPGRDAGSVATGADSSA